MSLQADTARIDAHFDKRYADTLGRYERGELTDPFDAFWSLFATRCKALRGAYRKHGASTPEFIDKVAND